MQPCELTSIHIKHDASSIRIERDYSGGDDITKFSTEFPPELHDQITLDQFQHTIRTINTLLAQAEQLSAWVVLDNVMECLSIYTWSLFFSTHYQRVRSRSKNEKLTNSAFSRLNSWRVLLRLKMKQYIDREDYQSPILSGQDFSS
ncbi:Golgin sub A member 7 [Apophysomyces sp. BC1021]|nr:Golgin sub A member 7 [Apophysomyces sp. BC1021]